MLIFLETLRITQSNLMNQCTCNQFYYCLLPIFLIVLYTSQELGGYWQLDRSDIEGWLELRVVECLCQIVGIHSDWAWAGWVSGALAKAVAVRLPRHFVNNSFVINVDGPQTYKYLQFSCGIAYNTTTHVPERGVPAMMITHNTGFPYPTADFQRIENGLTALGLDLEATLRFILEEENTGDYTEPYAASVVKQLHDVVNAFPVGNLLRPADGYWGGLIGAWAGSPVTHPLSTQTHPTFPKPTQTFTQ